ncbi:uncharacterized protein LOC118223945 isoform X10 [Anguilla anguilla]|uniref:uncharacterized protein LOC118223945 isoform X10 n=1 Tax=Anguilla anguilla TaxID=7936 RepID=UPI0015A90D67|nr:uncharacterized protein LOC118223945 isoform X10 [Anguilla anguilla]
MRWSQSVEGELAGACAAGLLPLPSPSARFSSQETRGQQSLLSAALPRRASRAPPHLRFPKKQTTQKALRVQRRYPQPGREPRRAFVPQSFTLSSSSGKRYCHPGRLCTNLPSPELLRNFLLLSHSLRDGFHAVEEERFYSA